MTQKLNSLPIGQSGNRDAFSFYCNDSRLCKRTLLLHFQHFFKLQSQRQFFFTRLQMLTRFSNTSMSNSAMHINPQSILQDEEDEYLFALTDLQELPDDEKLLEWVNDWPISLSTFWQRIAEDMIVDDDLLAFDKADEESLNGMIVEEVLRLEESSEPPLLQPSPTPSFESSFSFSTSSSSLASSPSSSSTSSSSQSHRASRRRKPPLLTLESADRKMRQKEEAKRRRLLSLSPEERERRRQRKRETDRNARNALKAATAAATFGLEQALQAKATAKQQQQMKVHWKTKRTNADVTEVSSLDHSASLLKKQKTTTDEVKAAAAVKSFSDRRVTRSMVAQGYSYD